MSLKVTFFSCIALLFTPFAFGQQQRLEAAKQAVDTLFFVNQRAALRISEEHIPLSKAVNDTFYITYFLDQAGELNRIVGNLYQAEKQLTACLAHKKNWPDFKDLSLTHNNLGKTYKQLGNYDLAFENLIKALQLMEETDNLVGQGYYLNNIGTVYDDQRNYTKAIEYYEKSFAIKAETKDSAGMASTSYNVGISYFNLKRYDNALNYFYQSYNSASYQKLPAKKILAVNSIVKTLLIQGNTPRAKELMLTTLPYTNNLNEATTAANFYANLAQIYVVEQKTDSALIYLNKAYGVVENSGAAKIIQETLLAKSVYYEQQQQTDSAYYYLKTANLYNDSLVSVANILAVAEMESKYNTERNIRLRQAAELNALQTQEELRTTQLQILYLIIAFLFVFGVAVFILIKYQSNKRNNHLLSGQNALIASQNKKLNIINNRAAQELEKMQITVQEQNELLDNVFSKNSSENLPSELLNLSKREKEVLANLALGLSNDQLAAKLYVSKSTVKTHLQRIFSKLLVNNRAEAVAIAHKYGIIGEV